MVQAPKFISDPHFYADGDGFHLKDGAPTEIIDEFNKFMEDQEEAEKKGVAL